MTITYFHRNLKAGFSINKVSQYVTKNISDKEEFYVPCSDASLRSIVKNILYVFKHRNRNGINHITGDIHYCIISLIGCKSVLTIHDTVLLDFNKYSRFKKYIFKLLWFDIPLKIATKVVCISNATKNNLLKYTNRKDIIVIPNMLDTAIVPCPPKNHDVKDILIIGTNPNKNVARMIEALQGLNVTVTIIGKLDSNIKSILCKKEINYINKANLTDQEIINEYNKTDILVFCSLFEGFGMPILEANAVGRSIVCSDLPVLREIAGKSAIFVNPYDVESIKCGITQLISDQGLRNTLIEEGYKNVMRFTPAIIMKQWLSLYNNLSNGNILR